jgi:hypothetical protein
VKTAGWRHRKRQDEYGPIHGRIRHVPLYDVAMTWDIHSRENAGTLTVAAAPFRVMKSHE